jgi:DNA-binding CsgD family transcriptional regulator
MAVRKIGKAKRKKEPRSRIVEAVAKKLGVAGDLKRLGRGQLEGDSLTPAMRRALLLLGRGDKSQTELARIFGVSRAMIQKDLKKLRKEVAKSIDIDSIVGDLVLTAETCSAKVGDYDPVSAWRIKKELAEVLLDLKVLDPPEKETGVPITLESLTARAESARIAILEAMDPRLTGEVIDPREKLLEMDATSP